MSQNNDDDKTRTHLILNPGTMIGHYRIVEKIGAGGMGEVYLAEDTKLKRKVAIKFLPTHLIGNEDVKNRFVREAQTVAQLNHPNVVSIYDVSEIEGRPYFVMELVEGDSLHHFAHDKPLPIDMIVEYAIQICQGLGEAHRAGIIHRDIKAANISLDRNNRIRLLDFGLAAIAGEDKITKTGSTLGTVSYMSPEQVSGRDIDHRSDLFSLGVVLYELVAGQTPFKRDSEGATLKAIIEDKPEPLTRYKSDVPEKLQEIIFELLEKDKEIRYQSAEGVIADLKRLMYDSQQSSFDRPAAKKKTNTTLIASIASAAVVIVAAVTYFFFQTSGNNEQIGEKVPMIAVIPFENLGSADDEYFADGMTDEITSRLAGIKGLGVISRTSSMKYKHTDKSLKEIGKELNVQFILEGTVRWSKAGDNPLVRITPQLIRVSDDRHMWADNYERELMQVFAVQADIAERIVNELGLTLVESDKNTLADRPTENVIAYQLYLRALNAVQQDNWTWIRGGSNPKEDIDSVTKLDPDFALAHALRSDVYAQMAFGSPKSENAKTSLAAAEKSLELQPGLPQGHMALGKYYNMVEFSYDRALEEFSMAKSELHNNAELLSSIAYVQMRQGRFEDAIDNKRRAAELDPLNAFRHEELATPLAFVRQFEEANQAIDRAIALEPERVDFYEKKIDFLLDHYGEIDSTKATVDAALENCEVRDFAGANLDLNTYLTDIPWDSLLVEQLQWIKDSSVSDTNYFYSLYWIYHSLGDREKAAVYADSVLDYALAYYEESPEGPYQNSQLGQLYANLGDCERAIEFGIRGKEYMTVDDCHW